MANFNILKAAIDAVIKANGQQEITGPILNAVLKAMVDSLGAGFELAGVATPSTNPGTPDQDVYWLAYQGGTYTNFGGAVLPTGISMLKWDGSWTSQTFFTVDDQLTPNSNNLAKSGVTFDAVMQGGVFDLSAYNGGTTYADLSAALTALNSLQAAYKRGGMSFKFVHTDDNKYVQFRCMAYEFTTDVTKWAIWDDNIYVENPDFIEVKLDSHNRILWAIKADGSIFWGAGVPQQVIDYVDEKIAELSLDEYEDIVLFLNGLEEGDKTLQQLLDEKVDKVGGKGLSTNDFTDEFKEIVEINSISESNDFIKVCLSQNNKILYGVKTDGTMYFGAGIPPQIQEALAQKANINDVYTKSEVDELLQVKSSTRYFIPKLDSTFETSLPYKVYSYDGSQYVEDDSVKGTDVARYKFTLPLSEKAWNVRFKFRTTGNLINSGGGISVFSLGDVSASGANESLEQYTSEYTVNGVTKTSYWGFFNGGTRYNLSTADISYKRNIGVIAFYVQYLGNDINASIENTGSAFVFKDNGGTTTYSFTDYPTVSELYEALKSNSNLTVDFMDMDNHNSTELAIFPEARLMSYYYGGTTGSHSEAKVEYLDNPPLYIRYGTDNTWHQVEIVRSGNTIRYRVDGYSRTKTIEEGAVYNELIIGDRRGILFENLEVFTDSTGDAEILSNGFVSSVEPTFIIFEGHGMVDTPICELSSQDTLNTNIERINYVNTYLKAKGYVAVSIFDIMEYLSGNKMLPKRSYTIIFDDYRFENCLNLRFRKAFTKEGIKPALAIVSDTDEPIMYNGEEISLQTAVMICKNQGFGLISHTRNHRDLKNVKPSDYIQELSADLNSCDLKGINGEILVYPYGLKTGYLFETMDYMGFKAGISVATNATNITPMYGSRYDLRRMEIGLRSSLADLLAQIR